MSADNPFKDLNAMFGGLKNAMGEVKQHWSSFVAITPGYDLYEIVSTGLRMQAAINGRCLYEGFLCFKNIKALEHLVDDISSKVTLVQYYQGNDDGPAEYAFVNDNTFIFISHVAVHTKTISIFSFNENMITTIKNFVEYYEEDKKEINVQMEAGD